ncbi:MAG: 2-hydroxychromene-2-carboxylate isomerase [bacterium]|nr:2-hydroxychromene-2-carboxylate isomerase [bacterium]
MAVLPLEFWFEFASTYSYLAAARIEELARAAAAPTVWRPFLLGPIFRVQGWDDSPFNLYPVKGRYMWRDMERLCERYDLAFRKPSRFPRNGLLAARITRLVQEEDWCASFVRAVYRANFAEDREIGEPEVIAEILRRLGRDADDLIDRAIADENKRALREQTERAEALGIFGAPSFVVGEELFWGSDRLDEALALCTVDSENSPER